jgi:hypothetical protein
VNFVASIGIALLLAAFWITWRDYAPGRALALSVVGTVALFFCHLMGLVFFYALIAGYELQRIRAHRSEGAAITARIATLLPMSVLPLGLYLLSPLASLPADTEYLSLAEKARQLVFPFVNYVLPLDIATAWAVGAFLLVCCAKGRCRVTPGSGAALLVVGALYLAAPWAFKGTYFFDTRFAIMLGFLLFGAVLPTGMPRVAMFAAVTTFTLLLCVRMAIVGLAWHAHRQDIADMRAVIATVAPGSRVFVAAVSPEEAPDYWRNSPLSRRLSNGIRADLHLPALLLIERRAYWPFLFDNPSQQPVETLSPYRELADRAGSLPNHGVLAARGTVDLCSYAYLLLLEADAEPDLAHFAADRLLLVAQSNFAALFRVRRSACTS